MTETSNPADRVAIHFDTVVAADSLAKRDVFRLPDPFAVVTVDGEQTNTTTAIKASSSSIPQIGPRRRLTCAMSHRKP